MCKLMQDCMACFKSAREPEEQSHMESITCSSIEIGMLVTTPSRPAVVTIRSTWIGSLIGIIQEIPRLCGGEEKWADVDHFIVGGKASAGICGG